MNVGPHVQLTPTPQALEWAKHARIVAQMDGTSVFEVAPPSAIRLFRHYFKDQNLSADPEHVVAEILASLGGYRHERLYVQLYVGVSGAATAVYIPLIEACVRLLHAKGVKVAGPSWYTGDYDAVAWDQMRVADWCGLDAICLQAYWADAGLTPWNALRYRSYWNKDAGDPSLLIIGECGRDKVRDGSEGTYIGRGGWKADGVTAGVYVGELVAFDLEISRDGVYAVAFTAAPQAEWLNYTTDELNTEPLWADGKEPEPAPSVVPRSTPMSELWVALVPSVQNNRFVGPDGQWTDEREQTYKFTTLMARLASRLPASVRVMHVPGPVEMNTTLLPVLRAQQMRAVDLLSTAPPGTYTVIVNVHTDSGSSHVSSYYGNADITKRLAEKLAAVGAQVLGLPLWPGLNYEQKGYLAWTIPAGKHCPVLLELGSHEVKGDIRALEERGETLAVALYNALLSFFGMGGERVSPVAMKPVIDPKVDAVNGLWHFTEQALAATDLAVAKENVIRVQAKVVELKRHLNIT